MIRNERRCGENCASGVGPEHVRKFTSFLIKKTKYFHDQQKRFSDPKLFTAASQLSSTLMHPNHVKFQVVGISGSYRPNALDFGDRI